MTSSAAVRDVIGMIGALDCGTDDLYAIMAAADKRLHEKQGGPFCRWDPSVYDTVRFYGRKQCEVSKCKCTRVDERNLAKCEELDIGASSVKYVDTTFLPLLAYLRASSSQLESFPTTNLVHLREMQLTECPIGEVDTTNLAGLEELWAWKTKLSQLNTNPLGKLRILVISDSQIHHIDLRPLRELVHFCADTVVSVLDVSECARLRLLQFYSAAVAFIDLRKNSVLNEYWPRKTNVHYQDLRGYHAFQRLNKSDFQLIMQDSCEDVSPNSDSDSDDSTSTSSSSDSTTEKTSDERTGREQTSTSAETTGTSDSTSTQE